MAAPSPSLSLSDIMHPLSPPPTTVPPKISPPPPHGKSVTPEPLELSEIEDMRRKILAMGRGDSSKAKDKIGSREQEMVDMLLRLTHPASLPQPSQLHAQAETIVHLIQQRDFIIQRSMEERERWEAEREGWARAAQALIVHSRRESARADKDDAVAAQYALVTADASTQRLQEFERANVTLQNDKKALQQKLAETQKRFASLESELAQLRPLLLMQPFALTHSHSTSTARGWSAALPSSTAAASRRERGRPAQDIEEEDESDDDVPVQPLQSRLQFRTPISRSTAYDRQQSLPPVSPESPLKPRGDYYRRREPNLPSYSTGQYVKPARRNAGQAVPSKPVLSDARTEHLLLAARKIGRRRASILSGAFAFASVPQPEPTPRYKQKKVPSPLPKTQPQPPRTPRRNANANTPLLTRTPLAQPSGQPPRTPLQSLLSAAQSVLSAPGSTSRTSGESPLAKKRKLNPSVTVIKIADTPPGIRRDTGQDRDKDEDEGRDDNNEREKQPASLPGGVARVRSALDFLADQAEVYSTQPPSQASADSGGSPPKDIEDESPRDEEMEDPSNSADVVEKFSTSESRSGAVAPTANPTQLTRPDSPRNSRADMPSNSTTPRLRRSDDHSNREGSTPKAPATLAPPINLTPRSSHSPTPRADAQNPRKRNRSDAEERHGSPARTTDETFLMFSLQTPQPIFGGTEKASCVEPEQSGGTTARETEGMKAMVDTPPRRTRSPYIKWTKEEDEQLAKAVAKHGQKWDLVQKALPSRGYHQVRQRWLRKLGVFDTSKLDLASLETNAAADFLNLSTTPHTDDGGGRQSSEPRSTANPKLGLAPLNSERVYTASSGSRSLSPFTTGVSAGPGSGFPFPGDIIANPQALRSHGEGAENVT